MTGYSYELFLFIILKNLSYYLAVFANKRMAQPATLFSSLHQPVPILSGIGLKQAGIQNQTHFNCNQ